MRVFLYLLALRAFQKYTTTFTTFNAGNRELTLGDNVFLGSSALKLINIPNVKSLGKGVSMDMRRLWEH